MDATRAAHEIIQLAHRYNDAVDRHDVDAWTGCFTADGVLESPFGTSKGRAELAAWLNGFLETLEGGTRHLSLNEIVSVGGTGQDATMRSSFVVYGTTGSPPAVGATGGYDEDIVVDGGQWRFSRRRHTVDASFAAPEPGLTP
jgi:ketosteroid isomerase-like protein